jgi:hypothetical protein
VAERSAAISVAGEPKFFDMDRSHAARLARHEYRFSWLLSENFKNFNVSKDYFKEDLWGGQPLGFASPRKIFFILFVKNVEIFKNRRQNPSFFTLLF